MDLLKEYNRDVKYDPLGQHSVRVSQKSQIDSDENSPDNWDKRNYPSVTMPPMSNQVRKSQHSNENKHINARHIHARYLDQPASVKMHSKANNEYYDFAKFSKKKLSNLVADKHQMILN